MFLKNSFKLSKKLHNKRKNPMSDGLGPSGPYCFLYALGEL
jgi:hypothetical protein